MRQSRVCLSMSGSFLWPQVQTPPSVIALISSLPIKHTHTRSLIALAGVQRRVARFSMSRRRRVWFAEQRVISRAPRICRHNAFTAGTERGTLTSRLRLLMPSIAKAKGTCCREMRKAPSFYCVNAQTNVRCGWYACGGVAAFFPFCGW